MSLPIPAMVTGPRVVSVETGRTVTRDNSITGRLIKSGLFLFYLQLNGCAHTHVILFLGGMSDLKGL